MIYEEVTFNFENFCEIKFNFDKNEFIQFLLFGISHKFIENSSNNADLCLVFNLTEICYERLVEMKDDFIYYLNLIFFCLSIIRQILLTYKNTKIIIDEINIEEKFSFFYNCFLYVEEIEEENVKNFIILDKFNKKRYFI